MLVLEASNKLRIVTPKSRDDQASMKAERIATQAILSSDAAVRRHRTKANQMCASVGLSVCGCDAESDALHGGTGILEVAGKVSHSHGTTAKASVILQKFDKTVAKKDDVSVIQRAAIALAHSYHLELPGISASSAKKKKSTSSAAEVSEDNDDSSSSSDSSNSDDNGEDDSSSVVDTAIGEDASNDDSDDHHATAHHGGHSFMSKFFHGSKDHE